MIHTLPQEIIAQWTISGPNSEGHTFICYAEETLWMCGYGALGLTCHRIDIQIYVESSTYHHRGRAKVLKWLKAEGLIST